jgi:hypothetical protein
MNFYLFILIAVAFMACGVRNNKGVSAVDDNKIILNADSLRQNTVGFDKDTLPTNKNLAKKIKKIQANVQRINAIANWGSIDKKDLSETSEGGIAAFYTRNGILEKITVQHFGEMAQTLTEYYLLNGQISFVYEKLYQYNRPVFFDSTMMIENEDNQVFDFEKSNISDSRSYFDNGKLLFQKNIKNTISSDSELWGKEEQRIKSNFQNLIDIAVTNK